MPVPFMNPYYFQNNPAFQSQQQYNPMVPYQDRLAQLQAQYNQQVQYNPVQQNHTYGLNGEIVDGIDVVKAKNVDMSGNVTFYPKADMSEIYTKQLMADWNQSHSHIQGGAAGKPADRNATAGSNA